MKIRTSFVSNSSSEAFVCNARFTVEEVAAKLRQLVVLVEQLREEPLPSPMFAPVGKLGDNDRFAWRFHKDIPEKWIGNTLILSAEDNSIPWYLFDLIFELFDCVGRIHLG